MNILFLSRLFYPHIGGVELHTLHLSEELIKKGHQISLLTSQEDHSLQLKENFHQIKIHRISKAFLSSKISLWQWLYSHPDLLKNADIIHAHDVYWWLLPFRPFKKTPIYTTFHGWEGRFPPTQKAKIWRKLAESGSTGNICVGDFISKWYGTKPTKVTYGATYQTTLPEGDPDRLLVLGRLSHDNDTPLVLDAIKRIKIKLPQLKVTFLGDGDFTWQATQVGQVLGFQPDIAPHLSKARFVVTSSYLSILDSLASQREVLSVYTNPLKKDYLAMHPAVSGLKLASSSQELADQYLSSRDSKVGESTKKAWSWAQTQTWDRLAHLYLDLWQA